MKKFDINRFGRTLVWTLKASKKEYTSIMLILFIAFFAMQTVPLLFNPFMSDPARQAYISSSTQMCIIVYSFFVVISGCWIFNNMKTKPQRITFKMLPATDFDKFLARLAYVTVFFIVGASLTFVLADLARMLFCLAIWHNSYGSILPQLFRHVTFDVIYANRETQALLNYAAFAISLWGHSFSILCGTFFRRRQVIFAGLSFMVLFMLFGMVGVNTIGSFSFSFSEEQAETLAWVACSLLILVALFNYWLSYKLFRRMQVINNKWINV